MDTNYFSDDIEILTKCGFVSIRNLSKRDYITIKNKNGFIEYHQYSKKTIKEYSGIIYHYINNDIDLLLLPQHKILLDNNMVVTANYDRLHEFNIPKWIGWRSQNPCYTSEHWLKFFGYFHSSGRIVDNCIIIDNVYNDFQLYNTLQKLPFKWKVISNDSIIINDSILIEYIKRYHTLDDKLIIPNKLKMTSILQILSFLKVLFNNNWREFTSSDYDYLSNIQQLVIKSGSNANIYTRKNGEYRLIHVNKDSKYPKPIISNYDSLTMYNLEFEIPFEPSVYVRRNGKAIICNIN